MILVYVFISAFIILLFVPLLAYYADESLDKVYADVVEKNKKGELSDEFLEEYTERYMKNKELLRKLIRG